MSAYAILQSLTLFYVILQVVPHKMREWRHGGPDYRSRVIVVK